MTILFSDEGSIGSWNIQESNLFECCSSPILPVVPIEEVRIAEIEAKNMANTAQEIMIAGSLKRPHFPRWGIYLLTIWWLP